MTTSDDIKEIAAAMAKAQAEMRPAIKDSTNPAFRSKYADLQAVWDACRGPLTANGIAVWQDVTMDTECVSVSTRLAHTSGQWVQFGPLLVPLGKRDAHGVGSATTYGKRFSLAAACGVVAGEDDDGNSASGKADARTPLAPPVKPADYDQWLRRMEAAADLGATALREAWKGSKEPYRAATPEEVREKLKAHAASRAAA